MKKLVILVIAQYVFFNLQSQERADTRYNSQKRVRTGVPQDTGSSFITHAFSQNLPVNRNGSGTSWLPDASPVYSYINANGNSNWSVQGNIVLRYNKQDVFNKGSRGGNKVDLSNWFLGMYNRRVGTKGLLNATAMISFDALTIGESGYPLLLQTGETYNGERLFDRQHPNDLVSALSVAYTHSFNKEVDLTAYLGYPGEPALGPVNFLHRNSAMNNPNAPLGLQWQDATRVSFGVATIGIRYKKVKLEGSIFTGREPDEDRFNFDKARFDSYSYRLSYNPNSTWAFQVSQGFLRNPQIANFGVNQVRTTASLIRSTSLRTFNWSHTLAVGVNDKTHQEKNEYSILYETNFQFLRQALYARYEYVKKSAYDLGLQSSHDGELFNLNAATIGYNFNIAPAAPVEILLGFQATLNFPGEQLRSIYGSLPVGAQLYLQLRPRRFFQ